MPGLETVSLDVSNSGDRPVQVGSHYHFAETNAALPSIARRRTACGSIFRPEPPCVSSRGRPAASRSFRFAGKREVYGFRQKVMGKL
jgi:urease subunit beta